MTSFLGVRVRRWAVGEFGRCCCCCTVEELSSTNSRNRFSGEVDMRDLEAEFELDSVPFVLGSCSCQSYKNKNGVVWVRVSFGIAVKRSLTWLVLTIFSNRSQDGRRCGIVSSRLSRMSKIDRGRPRRRQVAMTVLLATNLCKSKSVNHDHSRRTKVKSKEKSSPRIL